MKRIGPPQPWLIGLAMTLSALLGGVLEPQPPAPGQANTPILEELVPKQFGEWRLEWAAPQPLIPQLEETAARLYSQTLVRTYRSGQGDQVMLSIAYGSQQRDDLKAHRPEFCYRGQGFDIRSVTDGTLNTRFGALPVRRLHAHSWQRDEPITYWTTLGQTVELPGLGRHLAMFSRSLSAEVDDGMLVRISSLDKDTKSAWQLHERFIAALLDNITPEQRARLAGLTGKP